MAKSMIGIEIGACQTKLVLWDGARIRRAVRADTPDNLVKEGRIVSYEAMGDFLKEILRKHKLHGKRCAVVLPSVHVFLRRVTAPAMTEAQLKINLPYEFRDFLTQGKDKYFYDYIVNSVTQDEEGKPAQLDLTAAAVPKEIIEEYRAMLRRAGLKLHTAVPVECAYANLLRKQDPNREYCLLDLGHSAVRVHIFTGTRFEATRDIDLGLEAVDRAVSDALGVDEHVARSYKETDFNGAQTLESPMRVYQAMALDVRKAVNFYSFNNRESNLQDIWCCGGGSIIAPLRDDIIQSVELAVHPMDELMPPAADGVEELTFFAAAAGAAMQ